MNPIALSFFEKSIENLEFKDIYNLFCINKIPESYNLDYKSDYPKNEKLAKLMCSFANASGGYIIVGIEEVRVNNKNTGVPDKIIGVDKADHTTKITNIAISHSQPKIVPSVKTIEIVSDPDKVVVIIKIEESMEPIMYYSKNDSDSNKFFIRINDKKQPADYSILKKLFYKENYLKRMEIFQEEVSKEQIEFIFDKLGKFYKDDSGALFFGLSVLPFNKDFEIIDMSSGEFEDFLNGINRTFYEIPVFIDYRLSSFIKKFKFMGYYYESKVVEIKDLEEDIKNKFEIYRSGNINGHVVYNFDILDSESYRIERCLINNPDFIVNLFSQWLKVIQLIYDEIRFNGKFKFILRIGSLDKFILNIADIHFHSTTDIIEFEKIIYTFDLHDVNKLNEILSDIFKEFLRYFCEDLNHVDQIFPYFESKISECLKNVFPA